MGIQVDYSGTSLEGIPFQGCYIKLASFVADYNAGPTMTILAKFHVYVSRDTRLAGKQPVTHTTIPDYHTFSFDYNELKEYSFGVVEFIYERYTQVLADKGFAVTRILEENQTAPA